MSAGAVALALVACGGKSAAPATVSNSSGGGGEARVMAPSGPGFRDGALWSCQISDYDPQPCRLQQTEGGWELRKLLGSQRFAGTLMHDGSGFQFTGRFFCPWGACDADMSVRFDPSDGGYVGRFEGDEIRLRYDEGLEGEYGGAGYGSLTGEEQ